MGPIEKATIDALTSMLNGVDAALSATGVESRKGEKIADRVARALDRGDPLAALEAAERRLLERRGWTGMPGDMWLRRGPGSVHQTTREQAVSIERRRLAAKGGA